MFHEVSCITSLNLGLGNHGFPRNNLFDLHDDHQEQKLAQEQQENKFLIKFDRWPPSLNLGLGRDQESHSDPINLIRQPSNSIEGAVSWLSNSTTAKRERDGGSEEMEKFSSKTVSDIDQDELDGGAKKKLRLTKEQCFVLEASFKQHNTLNPKQKQTLATSLDLRPRQVEVWFQNRRARTKVKQNEVDCALLKKCCEALASDNRRLEKEIQQLKAIRTTTAIPPQFYMQFPAPSHRMCPSCERIVSGSSDGDGGGDTAKSVKASFSREPKTHAYLFSQLC
ncbi:hypothetical protein L2E82_22979 [Cichorium intybus]|uniref:Uncharacterized protein n=1 Tax=Cichorium intybus TaxID=13427 RepID=A0ACB9DZN4_CICIN|nr:hypothetical protein L2E82_22979 [Cichorium intybus]